MKYYSHDLIFSWIRVVLFDKMEKGSKNVFEEVHIDSKPTPEQNDQAESLLRKQICLVKT